jgi:hypothetical protein
MRNTKTVDFSHYFEFGFWLNFNPTYIFLKYQIAHHYKGKHLCSLDIKSDANSE